MNSEICTAATDPVSPMKEYLQAAIAQGFFSEPLDLLPGNLVVGSLDESVGCEVLLRAAKKALRSLAEDGHIIDTGRRVKCEITCEEASFGPRRAEQRPYMNWN
ncbi:hypothetical protein [Bradyrhizobium sp. WYCCWR 12699]|uniref:hypothetical protein n=1 Tax=Bradyrhizobium sp. WYCCWR 12699 TaxID=3064203 RepID=UPI0028A53BA3|nr:hypothetical protein [Bradyrhizobium sp. WYCCWR 12699]MDT4737062.1 hypothetical protein [Bradyrhizobium sp. WYCCWR 12699]